VSTVFVLGAGASIGAKRGGRTGFPSTLELLQRVREIVCDRSNRPLPALTLYLSRYVPARDADSRSGKLHPAWDRINVEELYAAIEFESRITDHLMLGGGEKGSGAQFFEEYFPSPYRDAVTGLMRGEYQGWMRTCYSAPISLGPPSGGRGAYGSEAFPHLHENFLRVVKMELLDSIAQTLWVLSEEEDTSNVARLVRCFKENDSVITFNYDLLVEQHLARERPGDWAYRTGYGLRPTLQKCDLQFAGDAPDHPSKFKVLKLHGSSNWHFFMQPTQRVIPEPFGAGNRIRDVRPVFFLATDNYFRRLTAPEQPDGYFDRFMIPPSTYKAEYSFSAEFIHAPEGQPLVLSSSTMWLPQLLYRLALQALSTADRIVFIGFSMAPADTSIRMLFRAAADANAGLRLVEIADRSSDVAARIEGVLPQAGEHRRYNSFELLLDSWGA